MEPNEKKKRRALTNIGGEIELFGDPDRANDLADALEVPPATDDLDDPARAHLHGFHTYPARMHPITAARLVQTFAVGTSKPPRVLDPFCGSGTVLLEGMIAGCNVLGSDVNPIAIELSRMKTAPFRESEGVALVEAARAAAQHANTRRLRRAGATRRFPDEDVQLFDPHVLLELDGIASGIDAQRGPGLRPVLRLVLSAILMKVSRKASDTSGPAREDADAAPPRRIAAGYPAKLFVKKTEELVRRRAEFASLLPTPAPSARVVVEDALRLTSVAEASIDAIVTSPPYVATYDYLVHHAVRLRWLGLDARELERDEMGPRRRYREMDPNDAERAWTGELRAFLSASARVLKPGAALVMLIADSALGGRALRADLLVAKAAEGTTLKPVARATQRRPHFHGPTAAAFAGAPRGEHALLLVASSTPRPGASAGSGSGSGSGSRSEAGARSPSNPRPRGRRRVVGV